MKGTPGDADREAAAGRRRPALDGAAAADERKAAPLCGNHKSMTSFSDCSICFLIFHGVPGVGRSVFLICSSSRLALSICCLVLRERPKLGFFFFIRETSAERSWKHADIRAAARSAGCRFHSDYTSQSNSCFETAHVLCNARKNVAAYPLLQGNHVGLK